MPSANRLDDFVKDFKNSVADVSFECCVFLGGGFLLDGLDTLIHLTINAEEYLKDVLRNLGVFKQGFLRKNCHCDK